jgi:hypothetical protein
VNEKQNDDTEVIIDLTVITEPSVYDFVDSISLVQLETTDDCLVSNMFTVKEFNGKYFVIDIKQSALFCFDKEGKYLFKIHSRGQGPNEYLYLGDFNFDPYNNQLILLDPWGAILLYDLEGNFISKTRLPSEIAAYNEVFVLNRDTLVFSSLSDYQLVYYSRKANVLVKKMYEKDEFHETTFMSVYGRIYSYNDSIYLAVPWSNEIINLSDDKHSVSYRWNVGKETFTKNDIKRLRKYLTLYDDKKDFDRSDLVGSGKPLKYYISTINETERYIKALIYYQNDHLSIFYDKSLKKSFLFKKTKENIQIIWATTNISGENMIITPLWQEIECLPYYNENMLSVEDREKLRERKEDDNPYLIIYKLKSLPK